jgi:1-acyl-sn-glycerol-3-phosphate acyltransferase
MKTFFYSDELNDDFAFAYVKNQKEIKDDYNYINNNIFFLILEFIVYRIIMTIIAYVTCMKRHIKIKNKKIVKKEKGRYFIYGNHTQAPCDAYIPNIIGFPRKSFIVVNPDALSFKGTAWFIKMSGSLPVPTHITGLKNFMDAMDRRVNKKHPIVIYPEAHLWPYYTKIRPYKSTAFRYPIKFDKPVFCFTTTYQKRRFSKKPKVTVYVDGPFYYDKELKGKAQEIDLRDRVYNCMVERSKNSNYEYVNYIKRDTKND